MNIRLYIDYDNLTLHAKQAGVRHIVTRSLLATEIPTTDTIGTCDTRIYGGWYEDTILTKSAQDIVVELGRDFPARLPFINKAGDSCNCTVSAELARSLEAEPSHHYFNTCRQKSMPRTLKCVRPSLKGCVEKECPLDLLPTLFETEQCPKNGCAVSLRDLIFRQEQKLVDTMLACDMIHAARLGCTLMTLVSSDDDLIPAIRIVLLEGVPFARLHPQTYHQNAAFPSGGARLIELQL